MSKIIVDGKEISIITQSDKDYINLTDMLKNEESSDHIRNWMRNRNTIEYLGLWENANNGENFKGVEFDRLRNLSGLNSFNMTPQKWNAETSGIGIYSRPGKNGGTYAHRDIAFHFAMWLSPAFHLALVTEFQRLKKEEAERLSSGWDYRRFLSKTNYAIHTDAIKSHIIPELTEEQAKYVYQSEADLLNVALFGLTAKQWKEQNQQHYLDGLNMRDLADVHELIVLSNLENNNAYLISKGMPQRERLLELRKNAVSQLTSLRKSSYTLSKIQSPFKNISSTRVSTSKKDPEPPDMDGELV
ncbi:MAG: KilA-N domain-containing protein [Bacteroidota bacterium]